MVQKEIRKKTQVYGTVAVLSAIVLVTLIYAFGSVPIISQPGSPPGILTLSNVSPMKTFVSYDDLKNFLASNTQQGGSMAYSGGPLDAQFLGSASRAEGATTKGQVPAAAPSQDSFSSSSYSTTNIQVEGVDEADIVKTDGSYVYAITRATYPETLNVVYILNANPRDPKVLGKIVLENGTYPAGMFLSSDSNRLVVLGSRYNYYMYSTRIPQATDMAIMPYPYFNEIKTFVNVYDVSNKANPTLVRNFTVSGSYFNSRMIGNYVYAVISEPAYLLNNEVVLPKVYFEDGSSFGFRSISASSIFYAPVTDYYFTFTSFIGLNISNDTQQPTDLTIMMGSASNMYVSLDNIYVTYPTWTGQDQSTSVYRIRVEEDKLIFEAKGNVTGNILNQYSMDEYNGYFRLATTSLTNGVQQNNIYVLNSNLTIVGKLENLAENERIYSARFMGSKCYLVTFRQIDPFFIVDLSNPAAPKVAGLLKIPGYSSYLHLYDETHVIGLGKENNTVKLSLFDVTDINNPTEIAKYTVDATYSDSDALWDPKAFLFDKQKQLLVVPVTIYNYPTISYKTNDGFWQGAYVFKLTLTGGFEFRGGITHVENATSSPYYYYGDYNQYVHRALYIDSVLYTVSNAKVKLNNLADLKQIAEIRLS